MAAKPLRFLLATAVLAGGLLSCPAWAQNQIGGSVQVNPRALEQLGPPTYSRTAPLLGGALPPRQFPLPPVAGRPPLPGEAPAPRPLIGETGNPRLAGARPRPARASTATRQAAISVGEAPARTEQSRTEAPRTEQPRTEQPRTDPAAAAAPAPAPAQTPAVTTAPLPPAPSASAPAASTPAPAAPAPSAPAASAPAPAAPAASAPTPTAPATPSPATTPPPAPTASAPAAPTAITPAPTPAPSPAPAPAPSAAAPAPAAPAPAPAPSGNATGQQQSAMVAPRPTPAPAPQNGLVTIPFPGGQGELPSSNIAALDSLAQQLANSEDRLQIRAYAASSGSDGGSGARRLALSRALAVRAYLIDRGIRSTRIDVRALGTPTDGSPVDRVEVAPVGR